MKKEKEEAEDLLVLTLWREFEFVAKFTERNLPINGFDLKLTKREIMMASKVTP